MKDRNKRRESGDNVVFMEDGKAASGHSFRDAVKSLSPHKLAALGLLAVVILLIIAVAGASGWLSAERIALKFTDMGKGRTAAENLPLEMNGLKVSEVDDIGYCFGVLDELKYTVYSPECNQLYSFTHNMSEPVTVSSEKRVIMYERGNYKIVAFSRKGELFTKTMENAVITADMNEKNEIAVATVSDRYLGQVTLLDSSGNERLTWYSADNYITDVCLSADGKQFAVSLLRVENGDEISRVCIFNVGETQAAADHAFDGETVFDIRRQGDGFLAVGTSSAAFFGADAEMTGQYSYDGLTLSRFTVAEGNAVLVFDPRDGSGELSVEIIDPKGEKAGAVSLDGADYICGSDDGSIFVCNGGAVTKYAPTKEDGYSKISLKTGGEVIKVLPKGEKLLILSIDGIDLTDMIENAEEES